MHHVYFMYFFFRKIIFVNEKYSAKTDRAVAGNYQRRKLRGVTKST
jgi:hypothetical protein